MQIDDAKNKKRKIKNTTSTGLLQRGRMKIYISLGKKIIIIVLKSYEVQNVYIYIEVSWVTNQ